MEQDVLDFIEVDHPTWKLVDSICFRHKVREGTPLDSSEDGCISIITSGGVHVFHLRGCMENEVQATSFNKLYFKLSKYAVSAHLGIDINTFIDSLPQFELYESVLRLELSGKLNHATPVTAEPISVKWSYAGLIGSVNCAIAVLTNTGSIEIFAHAVNEVFIESYIRLVHVTPFIVTHFSKFWQDFSARKPSTQLEELKNRAAQVTPTAICWSHLIRDNNNIFSLLIVGHYDGGITVWKFEHRETNDATKSELILMLEYKSRLKKITAMHWQKAGDDAILIIGDLTGKVEMVSVTNISPKTIDFHEERYLWNQEDNIRVNFFKLCVMDGIIYLFIVKGSFLIICILDSSAKILDVFNFTAGNLGITGIQHLKKNIFLVLTLTGAVKQLLLSCVNNKLQVQWRHIYVNYKSSSISAYGLMVSHNHVFYGVLTGQCKVIDIKNKREHNKLLIFLNMEKDPFTALMRMKEKSIVNFWDCLEMLRLDSLIEKTLPTYGIPAKLPYDKLSLTKLKIYLWLARAAEMMFDRTCTQDDEYNILPYTSIRRIIQIRITVNYIRDLLKLHEDGIQLHSFYYQSLYLSNEFLKQIIKGDEILHLDLGRNTIDMVSDAVSRANGLKYASVPDCVICKKSLHCDPQHLDMRCVISLMQVTGIPYFKCLFCKCMVHYEIGKLYRPVSCPFCDIPMHTISRITGLPLDAPNQEINLTGDPSQDEDFAEQDDSIVNDTNRSDDVMDAD